MTLRILTASITDKGLNTRKNINEDSYLILKNQGIFAVADGVGGAHAGDVASQSAVKTIKKLVQSPPKNYDPVGFIQRLIQAANATVYQLAQTAQRMMGSTLVLMMVREDYAVIGHLGDSRIYLSRDGKLLQLTKDHSKLQTLLDSLPENSFDEANYFEKHVITKDLGAKAEAEPDVQKVNLKHDDIFILCTDGIYNYNTEEEILQNVTENGHDLQKICEVFRDYCYEKGAKDHLTAIVLKVSLQNPDTQRTMILKRPVR